MGELHSLPASELPDRAKLLIEFARQIAVERRPDMAGFVVLAWNRVGDTTVAHDLNSADSPVPRAFIPYWVEEILRRDLVVEPEVVRVLRDIGLLRAAPPDDPV